MIGLGDPEHWADRFATLEERLLERIAALWPDCVAALPPQPLEDSITFTLVNALCKDEVRRRICNWVEYQFEPKGIDSTGALFSKGKIDMAAILDQDRDTYLAFECKRLNVIKPNGRTSLATEYVTQGVLRFVTEQYAEGLPFGCMLGYVLDGDVPFARQRIDAAIAAPAPVNLSEGPSDLPSQSGATRFRTCHVRSSGSNIELRHSLLA